MSSGAETVRDRVIETAMQAVAEEGWRNCSLEVIIARSEVDPQAVYREFGDSYSVIAAAAWRLDGAMLEAAADFDPEEQTRDRLFALLMARFDAARPWRRAIERLSRAALSDPMLAAIGLRSLRHTAELALRTAGIATTGPFAPVRVSGFAMGVLLPAGRAWLKDDSEDLSRTMTELDNRLRQAERLAARMGPIKGGHARRPEAGQAPKSQSSPSGQTAATSKSRAKPPSPKSASSSRKRAASKPRRGQGGGRGNDNQDRTD